MKKTPAQRIAALKAELATLRGKAKKVAAPKPVASKDLRMKVVEAILKDAIAVEKHDPRPYANGKYYFLGFMAAKVYYAAAATGGAVTPESMSDATVLTIAKDYSIK